MTVTAYDPILHRTFVAPTQAILTAQMNHPKMVSWRASIQKRNDEHFRLNSLHGVDQQCAAMAKRAIRNAKRLELQQAHG